MENNTLFGTVLRSRGYGTTSVGGRVNEAAQPISASKNWKGPKYDGWYESPLHPCIVEVEKLLGSFACD